MSSATSEGDPVDIECGSEQYSDSGDHKSKLKDRSVSWAKLPRLDSLHLEAARVSANPTRYSSSNSKVMWGRTLSLAFQSIGIVYGDIGTSPLYVFSSSFPDGIDHHDDILGVLSLIIYTLLLVPLVKYVFIVLRANDNGDGGTFALYSLICRHAKVSLIPNYQPEDRELSNYKLEPYSPHAKRAHKFRNMLENSTFAKVALFLVTIMGTSMVIGDGVLTPSISVLSAVSGIKSLGQDAVVGVSIAILVILFAVQRFGTDKVGFSFAPIVLVWFCFIAGIGLYNIFKYDIGVLRAFNPMYIVQYFQRNGRKGWVSLGGVFLCITGTEAMFADLGHFNERAIQISFSGVTLPALLAAYIGQAAFLRKFPEKVEHTFYDSVPDPLYWPTFVVAVGAAIIASQAMISGAFSIISQSLSLGCFPRVKVVHTSPKYEGQVYIPEINYLLMILCVIVSAAFKTTEKIGNAYGIAVVSVMVITTCIVSLIMLIIWKTSIWLILVFFVVFGTIEIVYMSAVMYKFTQGGFLPLLFAAVLMTIMGIWHYVHKKRYLFELNNKVSSDYIKDLANNPNISRLPGIGLLYSELVQGIPPIFPHFINNIPSVHSVIVFVSVKHLPISRVLASERFLFRHVEPREYRMFRCVVRYGYKDAMEEPKEFERQLVQELKEFIRRQCSALQGNYIEQQHAIGQGQDSSLNQITPATLQTNCEDDKDSNGQLGNPSCKSSPSIQSFHGSTNIIMPIQEAEEEIKFVQRAMEKGVVYLLGEAEVVAEPKSSFLKRIVVNHTYSFLRKNSREGEKLMAIPHSRLLRVGMTYEI